MEEGFVLMSLFKYKRWRALSHRVIAKTTIKKRTNIKIQKGGER